MPHPLEHRIVIKVQTREETDPKTVLLEAIEDIILELDSLSEKFKVRRLNS